MAEKSEGMTGLAERLAELRRKHGWSLRGLQERSGLSRSTISDIERGRSVPETGTLAKLAEVYGVSFDELVGGPRDEDDELIVEVGSFVREWRQLGSDDRGLVWDFLVLVARRSQRGEVRVMGEERSAAGGERKQRSG